MQLEVLPLSAAQVDYPSIREMHAASSFTQAGEVAEWRHAKIEHRVWEASIEQIEAWADRVLSVGTLTELMET